MLKTSLIDRTTLSLFNDFPREVSRHRRTIYNVDQLIQYVETVDGIEDVYISVYNLEYSIDKIFFDLDGINALNDAKALAHFFESENLQYIPIASGKKGYHIYLLLKPKQYQNPKQLLSAVTHHIIEQVFGKNNLASIDPCRIGDIKALCRIPNTLRPPENFNYCTYLPKSFLNMTAEDMAFYIKKPHTCEYNINPTKLPTLDSFCINVKDYIDNSNINNNHFQLSTNIKNIKDIHTYLKSILRPCLYNRIIQPEPRHLVRVASTIDLLLFLSPEQIFEIYARLKWIDWNPEETMKQIMYVTKYKPYSCRRLRQLQIPTVCCE